MPDKLTDNEIVKGFKDELHLAEIVDSDFCNGVKVSLIKSALDLINRQEEEKQSLKAEVERLERELNLVVENSLSARLPHCVLCGDRCAILTEDLAGYDKLIAEIKAEAYKEFAELLRLAIVNKPSEFKASQATVDFLNGSAHRQQEILDEIELTLKELVGEDT